MVRHALAPALPLAVVLWTCAIAAAGPSPILAQSSADSGRVYRVAPGDRLTITVIGQPELSGDFVVDSTGAIQMPILGAVDLTDLTTSEGQRRIAERLAEGVLNQPVVSLRVSEPRPIYVLGNVRLPGSYPFRYNTTVKSAIAMAGGYGNALLQGGGVSDFLVVDERLRQLTFQRTALQLRKARLEAQRDHQRAFVPPDLASVGEEGDLADLVADESETFEAQAAALHGQLDLLGSRRPLIRAEIESLNVELDMAKKRAGLINEKIQQYTGLMHQGLGLKWTEIELKIREAQHEGEVWRLAAEVARLQIGSSELDLKISEVQTTFDRQVTSELQDVRHRLKEIEAILPSAREIREVRLLQTDSVAGEQSSPHLCTIARAGANGAMVFQATETTLLEPGDTLEIKRIIASAGPSDAVRNRSRVVPRQVRSDTMNHTAAARPNDHSDRAAGVVGSRNW
jgi:polysaccharide export outer membrane protein